MIGPPGFNFSLSPSAQRIFSRWAIVAILLVAALFRFGALTRDARFHPDEALFATFARNAAVQGDWLLNGTLDKPPLALYASALGMTMFGVTALPNGVLTLDPTMGEFAARVPSALAGIVWVALMMALARRLYRRDIFALWVGLFAACSPIAVLFGASAFTDGWLLLWLTAALYAVSRTRWAAAGVCLALAFATKQQGVAYLPLALALGWALHGLSWRAIGSLLLTTAVGVGAVVLWDSARQTSPSLFALAAANNIPDRNVEPGNLLPRFGAWLSYGRGLFGPASAFFGLLIAAFAVRSLFRRPRTRAMNADLVFMLFALAYAAFHVVGGLNLYDRYWLPLLPPLILLAVRAAVWVYAALSRMIPRAELQFVAGAMVLVLLAAGLDASRGDPGYRGGTGDSFAPQPAVDAAAAWLAEQQVGAVVYDRWLGWQLGYYLGPWSDKRLTYFPSPEALAEAAAALDETGPRFFPVPAGVDEGPWLQALGEAGFGVEIAFQARGVTVYRLERERS